MDNFHLLGSIASIISLATSLGIVFWGVIKKRKISFFNFYMLAMVLIQAILIGLGLWSGKNMMTMIAGMFFMFAILFWLVLYLNERQLDLFKSQTEINKSEGEMINEINQDLRQLANLCGECAEIIKELMRVQSIEIDMKTKRLEDELKKLQKKIGKKKSTK